MPSACPCEELNVRTPHVCHVQVRYCAWILHKTLSSAVTERPGRVRSNVGMYWVYMFILAQLPFVYTPISCAIRVRVRICKGLCYLASLHPLSPPFIPQPLKAMLCAPCIVAQIFQGLKMIPPGMHLLYSRSGPKCRQVAIFEFFVAGEVKVWQWDKPEERFCPARMDDEEHGRYEAGVKRMDFDKAMGPYPPTLHDHWTKLTKYVTLGVLTRCGIAFGASLFLGDIDQRMDLFGRKRKCVGAPPSPPYFVELSRHHSGAGGAIRTVIHNNQMPNLMLCLACL